MTPQNRVRVIMPRTGHLRDTRTFRETDHSQILQQSKTGGQIISDTSSLNQASVSIHTASPKTDCCTRDQSDHRQSLALRDRMQDKLTTLLNCARSCLFKTRSSISFLSARPCFPVSLFFTSSHCSCRSRQALFCSLRVRRVHMVNVFSWLT